MIIVRACRQSLQIQVRSICASAELIGHQVGIEPDFRHVGTAGFPSLGEDMH